MFMQNWGRTLRFQPSQLLYPESEAEICAIVKAAAGQGKCVRVVGTAHSWTHLIQTPDILISLDKWQGVIEVDRTKCQAVLKGGTKLRALGELLGLSDVAMVNLGDIDEQSIAGAVSTGTHGTGISFGVIASQALEITVVTGTGELLTVNADSHPEHFRAAQVALGTCGIITRLKLQLQPAYCLARVKRREKLSEALANVDKYMHETRNFEMYAFPYSDTVQTIFVNETQDKPNHNPIVRYLVDVVYENGTMRLISDLTKAVPSLSKSVSKLVASGIAVGRDVNYSNRVYASKRLVRFAEMEYGVPAEDGPAALKQVLDFIEREKIQVHFPIEYRYVKGDDIMLSPAYGRDTCFISCHMYQGMPYRPYFDGVEAIMRQYDSRPHWGKMHTLKADELAPKYPKWNDFQRIRAELDPQGVFLNDYLRALLGVSVAEAVV
jgi:FAD-linked oxidoreductase